MDFDQFVDQEIVIGGFQDVLDYGSDAVPLFVARQAALAEDNQTRVHLDVESATCRKALRNKAAQVLQTANDLRSFSKNAAVSGATAHKLGLRSSPAWIDSVEIHARGRSPQRLNKPHFRLART